MIEYSQYTKRCKYCNEMKPMPSQWGRVCSDCKHRSSLRGIPKNLKWQNMLNTLAMKDVI